VRDGRAKTTISILIMVSIGPLGNVLLRKGMHDIVAPPAWMAAELAASVGHVLGSVTVWLGIACLATYMLTEMFLLSWADYSYVQPVSAAAYGIVTFLGYAVLGENVPGLRWLGVSVICLGVLIVGRTSPRTTDSKPS
jgi:drug/metabolite transporter (DMT)-like permease